MRVKLAGVTADLIRSRHLQGPTRRLVDQRLRQAFSKRLFKRYRSKARVQGFDFRVTVGDEFQFVIRDYPVALDAVTELRLFLAQLDVNPRVAFRAGIGVGETTLSGSKRSYEWDGPAFLRSREALETLKRSQRTALRVGVPDLDRTFEVLLPLLDELQRRWTSQQWAAIDLMMRQQTTLEAADALRVAHQNVSKRLQAAGWREFDSALGYIRERVRTL